MAYVHQGLIFGLRWCATLSEGNAELKKLAQRDNFYAEAVYNERKKYGFATIKKGENLGAAAVALAQAAGEASCIFIHRLNQDFSCCIALVKHLPVDDVDMVGPRDEMIEIARQFINNRTVPGEGA